MDTHYWSMALDVVGLAICGATLWFLGRSVRTDGKRGEAAQGPDFSCRVRQALSHQGIEEALGRIDAAVGAARRVLCGEGLPKEIDPQGDGAGPSHAEWPAHRRGQTGARAAIDRDESPTAFGRDPYEEAILMAERGLPAEVIARRVELPEAELDLIFRLRGRTAGEEKIAPLRRASRIQASI